MQAVRSGRAIPPKLLEPPPEVNAGLQLYMDAFWALCTCRLQAGRIPWTAVQAYADALGLDWPEAHDMHFLISKMDMVYVQWLNKKGPPVGQPPRPSQKDGPALKGNPGQR